MYYSMFMIIYHKLKLILLNKDRI